MGVNGKPICDFLFVINCNVLADTVKQILSPQANCSVNNTLIKVAPFMNQSFFQMADVTNLLLLNSPDRIVNRIEIRAVL